MKNKKLKINHNVFFKIFFFIFLLIFLLSLVLKRNKIKEIKAQIPTLTIPPNCHLRNQGDANCDGNINENDYNIWKCEFLGMNYVLIQGEIRCITSSSISLTASFNLDREVNLIDFEIWRKNRFAATRTSTRTPTPTPTPILTRTQTSLTCVWCNCRCVLATEVINRRISDCINAYCPDNNNMTCYYNETTQSCEVRQGVYD